MKPFRNVGICFSAQTCALSKFHPKYSERYDMVMSLINSYGLLVNPIPCSIDTEKYAEYLENLSSFHSIDYLKVLYELSNIENDEVSHNEDLLSQYGLLFDCSVFKGVFDFSTSSVANTMMAAKSLVSNDVKFALNWHGGWHHAKKDEASGFCYMNDIVYGIMILMKRFRRVLYIDIDLHHGDGVEEAFLHTSRVFTLSLHYSTVGFFPTSSSDDNFCTGFGKGCYTAARFPFREEGVNDDLYCSVFDQVLSLVVTGYKPDVCVLQCGTDGLATDPHKIFNLTHRTFEHATDRLLQLNIPLLLLGGGGYNFSDTAIVWCRITSRLLGVELSNDIPNHEYLDKYGPCFELNVNKSMRKFTPNIQRINDDIDKIRKQMELFVAFNNTGL